MRKLFKLTLPIMLLGNVYASGVITLNPNSPEAICPNGGAMLSYVDNHQNPPDYDDKCCQNVMGSCMAYESAHDHEFDGYQFAYTSSDSNVKTGVKVGQVHYKYTCDAACNCPNGDAKVWQPVVTTITCTSNTN